MSLELVPLRQLDMNVVYTFTYAGVLSPEVTQMRLYNDSGKVRTISKVRASVGTPPLGDSVQVDILKNGSSIFNNSGSTRKVTIVPENNTATSKPATPTWGVDEYLTVSIAQIGSSFPGEDLTINVTVSE